MTTYSTVHNSAPYQEAARLTGLDPKRMFQMPVFKPGAKVLHRDQEETVSHIIVRRREMMVYLVGHDDPIRPDRLALPAQMFTTERQPQDLFWYL